MKYLHYNVIKLIGEGGMGKVYLAEDSHLEKIVALKVLNSELCREVQFIERFKREAKIQSRLSHPNIVTLYNLLFSNDVYFIVMEYVDGITLQELIQKTGLIPENQALKIFDQILNGLKYAHSKGIIHRDIKPGNIMISLSDNIKIMDFGLAKIIEERSISRSNKRLGSLYYMSPEQINTPKDVDYRTDYFSLGVVLFEMLTGKLPYNIDTESDFKIMNEIVNSQILNPKSYYSYISDNTVKLIFSLTNKNRNFRILDYYIEDEYNMHKNVDNEKSTETIISNNKLNNTRNSLKNTVKKNIKFQWKKNILIITSVIVFFILILIFLKNIIFSSSISSIDKDMNDSVNKKIVNYKIVKYYSKVTDIDGNVYNTVLINDQEWFVENLNVRHYRNGDLIPNVPDYDQWGNMKSGAWCYYDNNPQNGVLYGKLYNLNAIKDLRGIAPEGWHVPSDEEWNKLINYLGGISVAGNKLKSTNSWLNDSANTNISGFSALPGGLRYIDGVYNSEGKNAFFWSSTMEGIYYAWIRVLNYNNTNVERRVNGIGYTGLSVRCVKD